MKIPVVYCDDVGMGANEWISLSKPGLLMNAIRHETRVIPPVPLGAPELTLAHSEWYVAGVTSLRAKNGFGDTRADVLKQIMAANACMITGAEMALQEGVAFAPVSGFHHAGYAGGHGFCTFNGLMIAFEKLFSEGRIRNALILDFDGHFGDGTQNIIGELGRGRVVTHMTRGYPFTEAESATSAAVEAIQKLRPDLVFLQAGADSLDTDPFGAGYFSGEQWMARDRAIFNECKLTGTPIVWNLAGGYDGEHTVKMHYGTWRSACDIWAKPPLQKNSLSTISSGASVPASI